MFLWQQTIHTLSSQNTTANLLCQLFNQLAVCCCVYLSLPTTSILVTIYRQSSSCCYIITQVSKHHNTTTLHSTVPATNSHCLETFLCTLHNKNGTQHDGKKWRLFLALWLAVYDIIFWAAIWLAYFHGWANQIRRTHCPTISTVVPCWMSLFQHHINTDVTSGAKSAILSANS